MTLTSSEKKSLRQIAHHLDPVVTVADKGLTDTVIEETQRALKDHELIKVRLALLDREDRKQAADSMAASVEAHVVQTIGKIVVLYKENPKPNPKLSNIARYT